MRIYIESNYQYSDSVDVNTDANCNFRYAFLNIDDADIKGMTDKQRNDFIQEKVDEVVWIDWSIEK